MKRKKRVNFSKMAKEDRAKYFSDMAIESLTKASQLRKKII